MRPQPGSAANPENADCIEAFYFELSQSPGTIFFLTTLASLREPSTTFSSLYRTSIPVNSTRLRYISQLQVARGIPGHGIGATIDAERTEQ